MFTRSFLFALSLPVALGSSIGASAQSQPAARSVSVQSALQPDASFGKFTPRPSGTATRLDYAVWDEALQYFVLGMGKSLRQSASRPAAGLGTLQSYGHDSMYRLEGNRIVFSYLNDDVIASLTTYREDLENLASTINIAELSRNEQLAFWMNLHNVAVIEQIALAYPVIQPSRLNVGDTGLRLDEAPFITLAGVKMSPKDIRTKIVYPHWQDPRVIYGFFRGDIGSPSIQRVADSGSNVRNVLNNSAVEFVNSLRGTQKRGPKLQVSSIYEEARPYFFPDWPNDLRAHLRKFATTEVTAILDQTRGIRADFYEYDTADLIKGRREPTYNQVNQVGSRIRADEVRSFRIPLSVARLLSERADKLNELIKRGELTGQVTLVDIDPPGTEAAEIE